MDVATLEFTSTNPATEEKLQTFIADSSSALEAKVGNAATAQQAWAEESSSARSQALVRIASLLRERKEQYALLITNEMGKPITEAKAEIEKCAFVCDYYAEHGPAFLADLPAPSDSPLSYVAYRPLGVVLAIMPWNFPFWQVFRFAAPALEAGNGALLKHADNVFGCAMAIEEVIRDAGVPAGLFASILIDETATSRLIADSRVAAITLTGGDTTGAKVARTAGENLKKCVLELGGSDFFIVLGDADIEAAALTAARSRFQNCGQSCIAAKRFIVVDEVADKFVERFAEHTGQLLLGDPRLETTQLGPLARPDLRDNIERQLQDSLQDGATLVCGGKRSSERGYFFTPTIIDNCNPQTAAAREETFGPLACVMRVPNEIVAIEWANASPYGLGGNLWTSGVAHAKELAASLQTGGVFINGMTHSDPRIPFGGVKRSGYGRELHSVGMHEFVNIQTVWVAE